MSEVRSSIVPCFDKVLLGVYLNEKGAIAPFLIEKAPSGTAWVVITSTGVRLRCRRPK
jgi:hypothetical protein